jgi:hypothetical protein
MDARSSSQPGARGSYPHPAALGGTILGALVAREWRWRGCSVAELALSRAHCPQLWWLLESASGVWITDERAARALRALEQRVRNAELAVSSLQDHQDDAAPARRVRFAQAIYASALAHWGSAEHPECLRAAARLLEAEVADWKERHPSGEEDLHTDLCDDLRIAALRRRWEAAERSERATAEQRALAFRRLVEAASAPAESEIRIRRQTPVRAVRVGEDAAA